MRKTLLLRVAFCPPLFPPSFLCHGAKTHRYQNLLSFAVVHDSDSPVLETQRKDQPPDLFFYEPDHRSSCLKGFALHPPTPHPTRARFHHRVHGWGSDFPQNRIRHVKGIADRFFSSSLLDLRQRPRRCGRLGCLM